MRLASSGVRSSRLGLSCVSDIAGGGPRRDGGRTGHGTGADRAVEGCGRENPNEGRGWSGQSRATAVRRPVERPVRGLGPRLLPRWRSGVAAPRRSVRMGCCVMGNWDDGVGGR